MNKLVTWFEALRPLHWIKSGFCLAALFFSGEVRYFESWIALIPLLIGMSCLASAGYVWNDLYNIKEDRLHPRKRRRPLASGRMTKSGAIVLFIVMSSSGVGLLLFGYGLGSVFYVGLSYLALTMSYTLCLRSIPILDVLTLSLGFVLRVMAGAYALELAPTLWLMSCTYTLSVLLGLGKRKGEFIRMEKGKIDVGITRKSLCGYNGIMLDSCLLVSGFACVLCYVSYALSRDNLWISVSVVFVVTGVLEYFRMTSRSSEVESPERLLIHSRLLMLTVIGWLFSVVLSYVL